MFGSSSPQFAFGNWSFNTAFDQHFNAGSDIGETDFEGLAIHCSEADSAPGGKCSSANGGAPDVLPDEPGGYTGFNALFGAVNINPLLTGQLDRPLPRVKLHARPATRPRRAGNWQAPPVYDVFAPNATDTGGRAVTVHNLDASTLPAPPTSYSPGVTPTSQILDEDGQAGFPGFDGMEANNALGIHGCDAGGRNPGHLHLHLGRPRRPVRRESRQRVRSGRARSRASVAGVQRGVHGVLPAAGSRRDQQPNTVFLVTVDEGDHYDGSTPLNPGCNGVTVACEYDTAEAGGAAFGTPGYTRNVGEVDTSLPGLLKTLNPTQTIPSFGFDFDDAPALVVPNQSSPTGPRPGPNDPTVRTLERDISSAQEFNPIVGHNVPITVNMADENEETILHMVNADPNREPTLTLFGDPSFFFQSSCDSGASTAPGCPLQGNGFAWNHGDIQPEIATTWQGWVGPGIRNLGETSSIWTDHTDARPTLMTVLGLHDDYSWDGAAIAQIIGSTHSGWGWWGRGESALPWTIRANERGYEDLDAAYKQLNAPFGEFGLNTLDADTSALASNSPRDASYADTTSQLQACESKRTSLVGQIQTVLQAAESGRAPVSSWQAFYLVEQADRLINDAKKLAGASTPPRYTVCS